MFIVRGSNETGSVSFACRTSVQVLEKIHELLGQGFKNVTIDDVARRCWTSDEFQETPFAVTSTEQRRESPNVPGER
jgi:hypothetical protein